MKSVAVKPTIIIGAGEAGAMVAREMLDNEKIASSYRLVGFFDDDSSKRTLFGFPVFPDISQVSDLVAREQVELAIIAIPSATAAQISRIIDSVADLSLHVRIVPGIREIIEGNVHWQQLRDIKPEDLLGREEISFEIDKLEPFYKEKTVLVTGGGGSIGSEICRQLLALPVRKVIALGHGENSLYCLQQELAGEERFCCQVCDVLDTPKLLRIMRREQVSLIFHAAAHKHVPLMESFPEEAFKNNVLGTHSVATAAMQAGVERFLFISTDKAVNPTSVMGASKRVAERIVMGMNQHNKTRFALTRFGNVLGSRGSVFPLFMQQIARGGPVTVTHKDIERYFMSIREAARLVIKAVTLDEGQVFVLDMGKPVRIYDFAQKLIKLSGRTLQEVPIEFTGLRPGEKMYEELLTSGEDLQMSQFSRLFISNAESAALEADELARLLERTQRCLGTGDSGGVRDILFEYLA